MAVAVRKVCGGIGNAFCNSSFLVPNLILKPQAAGMITKAIRDMDKNYRRPTFYNYKDRKYKTLDSVFDGTTWRFDENSKIVVVDGPITSDKDKIARSIAETFDLHYIPHPNLDPIYVNVYGYSLRDYNDKLPFIFRSFDPPDFVANPFDKRAIRMQMHFSKLRLAQYIDALTHVLNTGQGVVLNRCIFSDRVFIDTYTKFGFYRKQFKKMYYENFRCVDFELMRPHLIIYLDTPVPMIRDNLKKRNNPVEINSPVYQPEVLQEFENVYKNNYLKPYGKHAEVLSYNMEDFDYDQLVEDMEEVKLDNYSKHDPKMNDWRLACEAFWNFKRIRYTSERKQLEQWLFNVPDLDVPEVFPSGEDYLRLGEVFEMVPGNKFAPGYNNDMGDYDLLFKTGF